MMLRTSWLLLLLTLALSGVYAQKLPASVDFEHLTIPGSVRSSEVLDMIQDPEGVIWIATDGLIRYDGYAFTTYKLLPDSSSIGGQEINCLLYDQHQRRILVGTRNHGVVEYSYKTNRLRALPVSEGYPYVNSLVQTADGTIWASDFTSGIFYLQNDTVTRFSSRAVINPTSPYAWQDKLLVGQGSSILVFRNQSLVDSIPLLWENRKLNIYGRVTALHHDQQSRLYVGTEKQGVLIYDTDKRAFVDYLKPENNPLYNRINKIHIDREGLVWILTKGGGIALYSPKEKRLVTINKNILNLNSLSHDNCLSILEDQTGIIWVGSLGDLNKYDADQIRFAHLTYNPLQINSLSDKVVRGMIEDDESYLLAGTDGGYLNRINPVTLAVQKIEVTLPGYTGIVVPFYFTDFDKDHFLVSTNVGLLTMHKRSRTFRYYQPLYPYIEKSPVRQTIFHRGKLYYISSGSFAIYDPATQQHIKYYYSSPDPKFHIANPTSIFIDSHDRVWLGVRGGVKLIHDDFSTTDFTLDTRTRRPEGNYFMVLSMNEIDNKLWIGSFDSGLFTLDISQGINQPEITRISLPADFITTSIYSTLPDEAGNIWLSTNHGLLSYNPVSKLFNRFTLNEGLQDLEFNRLAYCKLRSGKMAFGGINGINVFDPAALQIKTISVKPSILSISSFSGKGNPFFMDVRSDSSVVLDATSNSFSIHFITPNYENPNHLVTAYRLLNYDNEWIETQETQARFSNLKPGNYRFEVRVSDHGSPVKTAILSITVRKPYWQTAWFISLAISATGLLIYGSIRAYMSKNLRDKLHLEELLSERTREIEKSRQELASMNLKKDMIFSILSHDLRGPLTTLKGFLNLLTDNTEALAKTDIRQHANYIRNSLNNSLDLLDNTLYWSLMHTGNLQLEPATINLNELVCKTQRQYQLMADHKEIKLTMHADEKMSVKADESMITVVLRNIISNAIKFTKPGKQVDIHLSRKGDQAVVSVIDEGVGMNTYYLEKLLSDEMPFTRTGTVNEKGTGLGIVLCRHFMKMNNGTFTINSVEKAGTECIITLPLAGYA